MRHWIAQGVKIFRVDNPHTKPLQFWEWLLATSTPEDPDVVFLAEAFTRPAVMQGLAAAGFQQTYTLLHLAQHEAGARGVLHASSRRHRRLPAPEPVREHPRHPHRVPAVRRARRRTRSARRSPRPRAPSYGVYAGYELFENVARPGSEENIDNEKYEYKLRDWAGAEARGDSLAPYLRRLNEIRRAHPALAPAAQLSCALERRRLDPRVLASTSTRRSHPTGRADTIIVVANVDPHSVRETTVHLDTTRLGLDARRAVRREDLITGAALDLEQITTSCGSTRSPSRCTSCT